MSEDQIIDGQTTQSEIRPKAEAKAEPAKKPAKEKKSKGAETPAKAEPAAAPAEKYSSRDGSIKIPAPNSSLAKRR